MALIDQIQNQINDQALTGLSQQLGTDKKQTQNAITQALPMLIGALAKQTGNKDGSLNLINMLDMDGDGSVLDDIVGFFSSTDNGAGPNILNTLLGNKRPQVEKGVSQLTDLNENKASLLLENLAPIVINYLGRQKQQQGLDASSIAGMLGQEVQQARSGDTSSAIGMITNLLDQDGDGSMLDDAMGFLGSLKK